MPATGNEGGKKAANRLSTSGSLETHDVWQKSIGHDPYAGQNEGEEPHPATGEINSAAKGLFRLAQLTGQSSTLAPGACKRCGQVGHLYFNCRNFMIKGGKKGTDEQQVEAEVEEEDDPDSDDLPSSDSGGSDSSDSDDSDDSDDESSDSDSDDKSSSSSGKKKKSSKKKKSKKKDKKSKHKKKEKSKKDKKDKKSKTSKKRKREKDKDKDKKDKKKKTKS